MAKGSPEMVTGARGPRDTREPSAGTEQVQGAIPKNEVWYQARYTRYRVQLTAPQDERLPDGRYKHTAPVVAQFKDAMLRLKMDNKQDARVIELLEEHQNKGVLFWNFQDVLDTEKRADRDRTLKVLEDPEQHRLIVEALKAQGVDFALPKGRKGQGGEDEPPASKE